MSEKCLFCGQKIDLTLGDNVLFHSPQENLSLPELSKEFVLQKSKTMKVGDLLNIESVCLIEVKIGNDLHDYQRLFDELTRMNSKAYLNFKKYCLYVFKEITHQTVEDYAIMVSACNRCNVVPVCCFGMHRLNETVKKILKGYYEKPIQLQKTPSNDMSFGAMLLACWKGNEQSKAIRQDELLEEGKDLDDALRETHGVKMDGDIKKVHEDMLVVFEEFFEKCFRNQFTWND